MFLPRKDVQIKNRFYIFLLVNLRNYANDRDLSFVPRQTEDQVYNKPTNAKQFPRSQMCSEKCFFVKQP